MGAGDAAFTPSDSHASLPSTPSTPSTPCTPIASSGCGSDRRSWREDKDRPPDRPVAPLASRLLRLCVAVADGELKRTKVDVVQQKSGDRCLTMSGVTKAISSANPQ